VVLAAVDKLEQAALLDWLTVVSRPRPEASSAPSFGNKTCALDATGNATRLAVTYVIGPRPTAASNSTRHGREATVEIPIFERIFSSPLECYLR
jgi:hypothetical protein